MPLLISWISDAINDFDGGIRAVLGENGTAGIFATYPKDFLSIWSGLGDQVKSSPLACKPSHLNICLVFLVGVVVILLDCY